jgi:UDP-2,3-diacylglucosamine pyrophosphatase LpxH
VKHTIVLSDLHLWEAVPGDGLWMRYRQRRYFPDEGVLALLRRMMARCEPGSIELVLAGDVFDFDVARPDGAHDPPRTEQDAVARMHSILDDHEPLLDGFAALLDRGHALVLLAGNHDLPVVLTAVREALRGRISAALSRAGLTPARVASCLSRVRVKGWFHVTDDGILIEHGNQYDAYTSVPHPLWPVSSRRPTIQQTMGSLTMRHLIGRLGYFNPNVDESFILSLGGYFTHWVRYYLFTRRSLALRWGLGTLRVATGLLRETEEKHSARDAVSLLRAAAETGCLPEKILRHAALEEPAALRRAARILCLDALAQAFAVLLALMIAWVNGTAGAVALALALAFSVVCRALLPDGQLGASYRAMRAAQREIARIHGVRAVVFGHTHLPEGRWEDGVFLGNCGSWSPMYLDIACTIPVQTAQPFVWLRSDGAQLEGGLYRFDGASVALGSAERPTVEAPPGRTLRPAV